MEKIMGTKKPIIQCILEQEYYEKFKTLCKKDERSESKLGGMIIKKYIDQYEEVHGEIKLNDK